MAPLAPANVRMVPGIVNPGAHAYFDMLAARADCRLAVSLRDVAHLAYGFGNYPGILSYDPASDPHPRKQDGLKLFWPENALNMKQLRFPIGFTRPSRLFLVLDLWFDAAWLTEMKYRDSAGTLKALDGFKMLQVTDGDEHLWCEPQLRFCGRDDASTTGILGRTAIRAYGSAVAPSVKGGSGVVVNGFNYGSDNIGPMLNEFGIRSERWTRFFIDVEDRDGENYSHVNYWVADEDRDPVQILSNAQWLSGAGHSHFWIEFNSSRPNREGDPMTAYTRNLAVIDAPPDTTALLQRP